MAMESKELNNCYHQTTDRLRVKVFIYFADQWREKGIGFLGVTKIENDEKSYQIYEDFYKKNRVFTETDADKNPPMHPIYKLTVRSQQDMHERLISTYITNTTDYRVQEGSILTWKEGEHEKALSFECTEDCTNFMSVINDIRQFIESFNWSSTIDGSSNFSNDARDGFSDIVKKTLVSRTNCVGDSSTVNNDLNSQSDSDVITGDATNKNNDDAKSTLYDDNEWNLKLGNTQHLDLIKDDILDKSVNVSDEYEGYTLNDNSSIWQDDRLPTLPEVSVDNLDKWIQLISFNSLSMSNMVFVDVDVDKPSTNTMVIGNTGSAPTVEDANQLYRYMSANNTLKDFFGLFYYYESEEHCELDILFKLHQVFRGLIATDNFDIYRLMFEESIPITLDVIGILEYDSTLETRVHHRDYLKNKAKFRKFFLLDESVTNQFPESSTKTNSLIDDVVSLPKERDLNVSIDEDNLPQPTPADGDMNNVIESVIDDTKQTTLEQICDKATLIYYIQYIIDHIMPTPSIFEDKLGPMTTYLNHHKADLCNLIYDNTVLLNNLFLFLTNDRNNDKSSHQENEDNDSKVSIEQSGSNESANSVTNQPTLDDYIDSVFFLHEFCLLSNSLNPSDKEFFFHWLESYNLLDVLTGLMRESNVKVRSKVVDIIALLVDNKTPDVRAFNSAQLEKATLNPAIGETGNVCLTDHLISTMVEFYDNPISLHCVNIINLLTDSDNVNNTDISYLENMELFCAQFFSHSFSKFLKLFLNTIDLGSNENSNNPILLDRFISLLTRWVNCHHDYFTNALVKENVISYVTQLLDHSHKFVVCGVVRLVRRLLDLKDSSINEELLKSGIVSKIADLFVISCLNCNSLLNNTIVELFNFLLVEDLDIFYMPLVEKYRDTFNSVEYIDTFKRIVARHDVFLNKLEGGGVSLSLDSMCATTNSNAQNTGNNNISGIYNSVRKRKSCEFENSEERWFNSDENSEGDLNTSDGINSATVENAINAYLYGGDDMASHVTKKQKSSPNSDEIEEADEDTLNNLTPQINRTVVEDENLFDLLMGKTHDRNKSDCSENSNPLFDVDSDILPVRIKKSHFEEEDDDVLDALSRSQTKLIPQFPSQKNKSLGVIKIHTNNFNSPRNLVVASNSKSTVSEQLSAVDESSLTDSPSLVINDSHHNGNSLENDHDNDDCVSANITEITFDYTNFLVETTFEDEPAKSIQNDDQQNDSDTS